MVSNDCFSSCSCNVMYYIDRETYRSRTLHYYVYTNNIDNVKKLLDNGADVNEQSPLLQLTPLHYAIMIGNLELIELLLNNGANANLTDKDGHTPIMYCNLTDVYDIDIVKLLLPHIIIDKISNFNECVTHIFADTDKDTVEILELLINAGAKVDLKNSVGYTPLMCATNHGNLPVVNLLLKHGADHFVKSNDGCTLLHCQSKNNDNAIILSNMWINMGIDINYQDKNGNTPLHKLCNTNPPYEHIKLFIDNGANVNILNMYNETAAYNYLYNFNNFNDIYLNNLNDIVAKNIKLLIDNLDDINTRDKFNQPLFKIISDNKNLTIDIIKIFIDKNLKIELDYEDLYTIMQDFVRNNVDIEVIKYWLNMFPNINIYERSYNGSTLLHYAASNKNSDILKFILTKNFDVNAKNDYGETPLFNAVINMENVKLLIDAGADVTVLNNNNETILFNAVRSCGDSEVIKMLIQKYMIDVNVVSTSDDTVLTRHNIYNIDFGLYFILGNPSFKTLLMSVKNIYNNNETATYIIKNLYKYLTELLIKDSDIFKNKQYINIYNAYKKIINEILEEINSLKNIYIGSNGYSLFKIVKLNNPDITYKFINNSLFQKQTSLKFLGYKFNIMIEDAKNRLIVIDKKISELDSVNSDEWNMLPIEIKHKIVKYC
ncbi:ankyrin repeat protein [Hypsugopox virus]|nr:ankyrin repeat protein [Hypsugopox virus]